MLPTGLHMYKKGHGVETDMKKLLIILILLLYTPLLAGDMQVCRINPAILGGGVVSSWTSGCPNASLLLCESFDGESLCTADYSSNCDNTDWVASVATPDYNNTNPLDGGTYALYLTTGAIAYHGVSATSPIYIYFKLKIPDIGSSTSYSYVIFYTSSTGNMNSQLFVKRSGSSIYLSVQSDGGSTVDTVGTLAVGTTYHVWYSYTKSSGANNATSTVAFSTDGTRPTSGDNYAASTNGVETSTVNRIHYRGFTYDSIKWVDIIVDKIRVDDAQIGDNPS